MKKLTTLLITFSGLTSFTQVQQPNPFESIGQGTKILTLSNGKYQEVFTNDTLRRIGNVVYNIIEKKIDYLVHDSIIMSEDGMDVYVVSRWLSRDPLATKYPSMSPYNAYANNPIANIDPDGGDVEFCIATTGEDGYIHYKKVEFSQINKEMQQGLLNYMQTDQGLAYIKRYMKAGQTVGNYTATEDGDLSDHVLKISESRFEMGMSSLGRTSPILLYDKETKITLPPINFDWWGIEEKTITSRSEKNYEIGDTEADMENLVEKRLSGEGTRIVTLIHVFPYAAGFENLSSEEQSYKMGYTIGHETFIHATRSWTAFTAFWVTGDYAAAKDVLRNNAGKHDGEDDHQKFRQGADIPSIKLMGVFINQYKKIAGEKRVKQYEGNDRKAN